MCHAGVQSQSTESLTQIRGYYSEIRKSTTMIQETLAGVHLKTPVASLSWLPRADCFCMRQCSARVIMFCLFNDIHAVCQHSTPVFNNCSSWVWQTDICTLCFLQQVCVAKSHVLQGSTQVLGGNPRQAELDLLQLALEQLSSAYSAAVSSCPRNTSWQTTHFIVSCDMLLSKLLTERSLGSTTVTNKRTIRQTEYSSLF